MQVITGTVVEGHRYGRTIGFPTANLKLSQAERDNVLKIRRGIYAGFITREVQKEKCHPAGIVITENSDGSLRVEGHLIGFQGDLYRETLTFELIEYLRPYYEIFEDEEELKEQIKTDIKRITSILEPKL